jgi:hypothetical protein
MKTTTAIIYFILFTIIIALPPVLAQQTGNGGWLDAGFWTLFVFMTALTLLLLTGIVTAYHKKPEYFAQAFLAGTTLKILLCFVFIFFFLRNNKVNKLVFLADFFYTYLLNTAFEIYVLLRNLRHKNLR